MKHIDQCKYKRDYDYDGQPFGYTFQVICPTCEAESNVSVLQADLFAYRQGANVQDAFPYLSSGEREGLVSGMCDGCWDEMFPPDPSFIERLVNPVLLRYYKLRLWLVHMKCKLLRIDIS